MRVKLDLSNIQASDTIIVANNRQALAFKLTIINQLGAIKMPKIYSYPAFIKKAWSQLNPQGSCRLLSDLELKALLCEIISESTLKNPSMLANEAMKCYRLIKTHFIDVSKIANHQNSASALFIDWLASLKKVKNQSQLIDSTDLFSRILPALEGTTQAGNYYHYGIKKPTPEQGKLFNVLQSQTFELTKTDANIQTLSYETIEAELQSIAEWSKKRNTEKPNEQIAIVIPNLGELQNKICSIFDEVFQTHGKETQAKPYNISLGSSLSSYPLIRQLFKIINLSNELISGVVELETLIQVIPSPYIKGAHAEANNRALFINRLLSLSKSRFSVKRLMSLMTQCPILLEQINTFTQIKSPKQATLEQWLDILYQLLDAWSFGTDRALSSSEYQLFEKFQKESLILNQSSETNKKVSINNCIERLRNHFDSVIFQPKAGDANIHILGVLEAEGLDFDAVWIAGMTSDFLPGAVKFPLFIPGGICTEFHLPLSSFEIVQKNAISTLHELKTLSDNIRFSYAKVSDGREQIATPLLSFEPSTDNAPVTQQEQAIITLEDNSAPSLESTTIKQGVQTLQDQMSCPFKGFVRRLKIQAFESDHLGFDRAEQGVLIHKILETLFSEISSSSDLKALSDYALERLIEVHTTKAIGKTKQHYQVVEQERIMRVIAQYINLEKQRSNFEVLVTESVVDVCIEGLKFTTKLDRMDLLPNGDKVIIDYKTGQSTLAQITGETIEQAQLPIYAISNEVSGVAFAQINASECVFKAISKDRECLPVSKQARSRMPDWDEQLSNWKTLLSEASIDFQQGVADVLPAKHACDYCDYDLLCRVEKTPNHS